MLVMGELAFHLGLDALVVASVTLVISRSKLFAPLREWLEQDRPRTVRGFLGHLVACTFCTSFWVAGVLILGSVACSGYWDRGHLAAGLVAWLALPALASPLIWLIYTAHKHVTKE